MIACEKGEVVIAALYRLGVQAFKNQHGSPP
jgi:hypothetical protein